jgi:hypothetical protein
MNANTKKWIKSVAAAVIGGAANSITVVIVDPIKFNLFQGGAREVGTVALVGAVLSLAMYLKQHPVPDEDPRA